MIMILALFLIYKNGTSFLKIIAACLSGILGLMILYNLVTGHKAICALRKTGLDACAYLSESILIGL